jgi:hypothetical protein
VGAYRLLVGALFLQRWRLDIKVLSVVAYSSWHTRYITSLYLPNLNRCLLSLDDHRFIAGASSRSLFENVSSSITSAEVAGRARSVIGTMTAILLTSIVKHRFQFNAAAFPTHFFLRLSATPCWSRTGVSGSDSQKEERR